MQRLTTMLQFVALTASVAAFTNPYPYTHTNCGIEQTITDTPTKVVSMNQAATEFLLALGLQNNIVGQRKDDTVEDPIWFGLGLGLRPGLGLGVGLGSPAP